MLLLNPIVFLVNINLLRLVEPAGVRHYLAGSVYSYGSVQKCILSPHPKTKPPEESIFSAANIVGPRSSSRRLLMSSVTSTLSCGVDVWGHALTEKCSIGADFSKSTRQVHWGVASAYRPVSEPTVLVIAGVVQLQLLARGRQAICRRRL